MTAADDMSPRAALDELESQIIDRVLDQLRALPLEPGRPLIAVDADEVLVYLADHLKRFLAGHGIELRLTKYQLEGTMFPEGAEHPLGFEDSLRWIDRFFEDEVLRQEPLPGAVEILKRLEAFAQIIVLTNVPKAARERRIENLAALGIDYPLVENSGGKGKALAWLFEVVEAPVIFIDDSPRQIESAAEEAPEVLRIHFAGIGNLSRLIPDCAAAHHRASSWLECEAHIREFLGAGEAEG